MAQLTQEDIEYLKKNGYDPNSFQAQEEQPQEGMSKGGAALATLKGHAGGILGGGAGAIGGTALGVLGAPETGGLSLAVPLILGALGGAGGGALGQKAQQGIQSDETNQTQKQQLEQAEREHPYVSMATDIGASALASGGSPSLRTPLRALMGDGKALKSIAINSAVNPAINSGINLATTGQLPSMSDLGMQALGGAVMSGNRNPLGRLTGLHGDDTVQEPTDKNNVPDSSSDQTLQLNAPRQPLQLGQGIRFQAGDVGKPTVDAYNQTPPHPDMMGDGIGNEKPPIDVQVTVTPQDETTQPKVEQPTQPAAKEQPLPEDSEMSDEEKKQLENMDLNPESGSVGKINTKGGQKLQDWADYQEASKRMQAAEPGSDEWMQAWKDREGVKNRQGGVTPEEPEQTKPTIEVPNKGVTGESGFFRIPSFLHKGAIENVEDLSRPEGKLMGAGFRKKYQTANELKGQLKNPVIQAGKGATKSDLSRINEILTKEDDTHSLYPPTAQDSEVVKKFYKAYREKYGEAADYAIQNNIPIVDSNNQPRLMQKIPGKVSWMPNQKVEDTIRKGTDLKAIQAIRDAFDSHNQQVHGLTPQASKQRTDNFFKVVQGDIKGSNVSHEDWFNAMRKEAGLSIPPEVREQNPVKNASRYFDRFSEAAAFYKHIESNHSIMSALGAEKDPWGKDIPANPQGSLANNSDVQSLLQQSHHSPESNMEKIEGGVSGITTASLIAGPPLEVHKILSNFVKAISFARNPYQAAAMVAHTLTNWKEGYQHAVENNVMKLTANSTLDMFNGALAANERMQGVARGIRQVATLGDLTTKFNAGMIQSMMESIIPKKIQSAEHGNITDQNFMKRVDPDYKVGKMYTTKEMQQFASVAASYIHGTGDARQMPSWMLNDTELSGFFSLAHWSVAQTNNFVKDVLEPAQRGDIVPLITSVFGAAVGGYLIKELRQDISGKKNPIPSLQEIQAGEGGLAAHKSLLAYNLIAAMQYSGFGGLLSQIAKYPFDFAYKNQPQGATFPLDELATDLAGTLHHVSEAIANDPNVNWIDLSSAVSQHLLQNNMMLARIAINQGINAGLIKGLPAEKKALSDRLNQLRRFDEIQGLPYNDIDSASNPYMNLEQKKFKYDENPQEAIKMLPDLISGIMTRYQGKPDVIMSKLKGLKENQYSTFPSMQDMPLEMMKYFGYLQREEGPEQAQAELQDYLKHKMINETKASVVP